MAWGALNEVPGVVDPQLLPEDGRENATKATFLRQYVGRLR